jgi:prepilin-type N-terminal cleavage/methylation domain-containing protein
MRLKRPSSTSGKIRAQAGFSLVEMLIVIAIIAVLASMVVTAVSNAAFDSSHRIADQQQASLQQALSLWVSSTASTSSVARARELYNAATTHQAKLNLIAPYLDDRTRSHLTDLSAANRIESDALRRAGRFLTFTPWTVTNGVSTYPVVANNVVAE